MELEFNREERREIANINISLTYEENMIFNLRSSFPFKRRQDSPLRPSESFPCWLRNALLIVLVSNIIGKNWYVKLVKAIISNFAKKTVMS